MKDSGYIQSTSLRKFLKHTKFTRKLPPQRYISTVKLSAYHKESCQDEAFMIKNTGWSELFGHVAAVDNLCFCK